MAKRFYAVAVLVLIMMLMAACGGGGTQQTGTTPQAGETAATSGGAGDAEAGKTLFAQQTIGALPGCATCHSLDGTQLVGPTLQGIGTRAATEVEGQSAEEYLHTSIVDPNAHVVEGFAEGIMPAFEQLDDTQLNNLVAYLLTLK